MTAYASKIDMLAYLSCEESALPEDADRMLERASDLIDYTVVNPIDLEVLTAFQTGLLTKAVCAQVDDWIQNGEFATSEGVVKSKSVGRVSVSYADTSLKARDEVCDRTRQYLTRAGLLYRGLRTV